MSKIVRTPTRAEGGITPEERAQMDEVAREWIDIAMCTDPVEPEKIVPAIEALYAAADLEKPRVVIVPSPLVMAFAYGASAAIWHQRIATDSATDIATRTATNSATYSATVRATRSATESAEGGAAQACFNLAGQLGLECAKRWHIAYQGGNMWAAAASYLAAARDVLGLRLPEHEKYQAWEDCARHGGFRVMHERFCLVCDRPEIIRVDENNEPHCENGPSHRWRDGFALYHWHGVRVPAHWIESPETVDPAEVIAAENVEARAAGAAIIGWPRMLKALKCKVIDDSGDMDRGRLIELTLPGLDEPGRFLHATCPRNGDIVEGVPYVSDIDGLPIDTVLAAQAWRVGDTVSEYQHPPSRS
ncbi:MAG: hypothetical protein MJH10_10415 [Epibacterium sp.]|nr:hypothetical protein [Epibacterium sp.]NQX73953.1 hypothetical protein [Epibacterium sp.]